MRCRMGSEEEWNSLERSERMQELVDGLKANCVRSETHRSQAFNGHLGIQD